MKFGKFVLLSDCFTSKNKCHFGFVSSTSPQKDVLGLPPDSPMDTSSPPRYDALNKTFKTQLLHWYVISSWLLEKKASWNITSRSFFRMCKDPPLVPVLRAAASQLPIGIVPMMDVQTAHSNHLEKGSRWSCFVVNINFIYKPFFCTTGPQFPRSPSLRVKQAINMTLTIMKWGRSRHHKGACRSSANG